MAMTTEEWIDELKAISVLELSERIKAQWFNGRAYNSLHGQPLRTLPSVVANQPDPEMLRWHNDHCFEQEVSRG